MNPYLVSEFMLHALEASLLCPFFKMIFESSDPRLDINKNTVLKERLITRIIDGAEKFREKVLSNRKIHLPTLTVIEHGIIFFSSSYLLK